MKTCRHCKANKPLDAFYNSRGEPDGLTRWCRTCMRDANKAWRDRDGAPLLVRQATARWRERNPDYRQPYNPEKQQARNAVNWAVIRGDIVKPDRCSACGTVGRVDGHHRNGYDPAAHLDIVWLCKRCHGIAHRK